MEFLIFDSFEIGSRHGTMAFTSVAIVNPVINNSMSGLDWQTSKRKLHYHREKKRAYATKNHIYKACDRWKKPNLWHGYGRSSIHHSNSKMSRKLNVFSFLEERRKKGPELLKAYQKMPAYGVIDWVI